MGDKRKKFIGLREKERVNLEMQIVMETEVERRRCNEREHGGD